MLNSLKLTVSFKFFPVGKEIWFLQKTAGLRGRVSHYRVLLWRERDGNLHTVYSHVPANTPTFWKSTAPRLTSDAANMSKSPSCERELCSPESTAETSQPQWDPGGTPAPHPSCCSAGVPGPRATGWKAIPSKLPRQPEPYLWTGIINPLINIQQVAGLWNATGTY